MSIPDDTPDLNPSGFDPDFATARDWADMYRGRGLQVIPSYLPGEIKGSYKRPLVSWADLQDAIAPDLTYDRWYGTKGDHRDRVNMGILTGRCSGNVFVIDLDTHTHPETAGAWWQGQVEKNTGGEGIITPCQKTGGGGIQMLFRAPVGWLVPTNKTSIGVDIRGQGGFAVMPPSKHEKGVYEWLPGNEPWIVPIADAPGWLIEAVMEVVSDIWRGIDYWQGARRAPRGFRQRIQRLGASDRPPRRQDVSHGLCRGGEMAPRIEWCRAVPAGLGAKEQGRVRRL